MKLRVKNHKGNIHEIEIDGNALVRDLKALVADEFGIPNSKGVKLICKGKVLKNDLTLQSSNLKDNSMVVMMVLKGKHGKMNKGAQAHQAEIDEVVEAGFERPQAIAALRRVNWNVEEALITLEGEALDEEDLGPVEGEDYLGDIEEGDLGDLDDLEDFDDEFNDEIDMALDEFMMDPKYEDLREQIRNNPENIDEFSDQIKDINPALYELIMEDPELLEDLVEEVIDMDEDDIDGLDEEGVSEGEMGDDYDEDNLEADFTPEDQENISQVRLLNPKIG